MPKFLANIDGNSQVKAVNFVDPTSAQDLATKNYVDSHAATVRKFAAPIGDGTSTSLTVTHTFNTQDVETTVYDLSSFEVVYPTVVNTDVNTVTITFAVAPTVNQFQAVVIG